MREIPYLLTTHYIVIVMRPISFPASKAEIIEKTGEETIPDSPGTSVLFKEILRKIPLDSFSCAAEFYSALNAS
jgi:hypothetical protein